MDVYLEENKNLDLINKYFRVLVATHYKESSEQTFVEKIWKAVIWAQKGWAYYRFLDSKPDLHCFIGPMVDLPSHSLSIFCQEKRVCLLLAREFNLHNIFKIALQINLAIPPNQFLRTGCNLDRHSKVIELYDLLDAGLGKFEGQDFWYRVKRAAKDAGLLTPVLHFFNRHGFQELVGSSEEGLDAGQAGHSSPLDPTNPL